MWFDNDHTFLDIAERVHITTTGPRRLEYAYHLVVDGEDVTRWHRDPTRDAATEYHVDEPDQSHQPSTRISLTKAIKEAWGIISDIRGEQADARDTEPNSPIQMTDEQTTLLGVALCRC